MPQSIADLELTRARVLVRGVVQGVGFPPFVHRLAHEHGLKGWVLNSTEGVVIEVEGPAQKLEAFLRDLEGKPPPRAVVAKVEASFLPPLGYASFTIEASLQAADEFVLISPDISLCSDCLRELFTPADRRFRYPFINCTNCGPRFTIVKDIPYDRPKTTMGVFQMCPQCQREDDDPADRRVPPPPHACPPPGLPAAPMPSPMLAPPAAPRSGWQDGTARCWSRLRGLSGRPAASWPGALSWR